MCCFDKGLDGIGLGKHWNQEVVRFRGVPDEGVHALLQLLFVVLFDAGVVDPNADAFRVEVVSLDERLDAAEEDAVLEVALLVVRVFAAPPAMLRRLGSKEGRYELSVRSCNAPTIKRF